MQATAAVQKLTQAEARKKSSEEALENLKKRIAAAKQTYLAGRRSSQGGGSRGRSVEGRSRQDAGRRMRLP